MGPKLLPSEPKEYTDQQIEEMEADAYEDGKDDGYKEGYAEGYSVGYNEGLLSVTEGEQ
jgi:flagellar biosynthesis/type III secretory pathway protein FliH